jgi:hypothetical protein
LPDGRDYSPRRSLWRSRAGSATPAEAGGVRPDRHFCAGHAPWKRPEGATTLRAVFRADGLFGLLLGVVLVMAAFRSVLAVVTELFQLVVEGLDGGFARRLPQKAGATGLAARPSTHRW